MKLHVVFDPNGTLVGDLDSMDFAKSQLELIQGTDKELEVRVANGLVIYAFRVLVKEGLIAPYNELFLYNIKTDPLLKKPILVDKNGEQSEYPIGMLDEYSNILCRLI